MSLTPEQRSLRGRIGAHVQWSRERDPSGRTAKARAAFLARFDREVDPNNELPAEERIRRAEHARQAYFARLAFASARARSKKDSGRRTSRSEAAAPTSTPPLREHPGREGDAAPDLGDQSGPATPGRAGLADRIPTPEGEASRAPA